MIGLRRQILRRLQRLLHLLRVFVDAHASTYERERQRQLRDRHSDPAGAGEEPHSRSQEHARNQLRGQRSCGRSFASLRMTARKPAACSSIAAALYPVYECLP
jgi:hypothetical protein